MLSSISWSQFIYVLVIALAIYYLYIAFKFYGDELNAIVKGKSSKPLVQPSTTDVQRESLPLNADTLLGKTQVKRPEIIPVHHHEATHSVMSTVLPDPEEYDETEIIYETVEQVELDLQDGALSYSNSIPLDSLNDLVDGIDQVITNAGENETDKDSMASALRALLEPHQNLNSQEFRENITEHIVKTAEQSGAPVISKTEVAGYWDKAFA